MRPPVGSICGPLCFPSRGYALCSERRPFFVTREATQRASRISWGHWGQAIPERCPKSSRYYMALTEVTRGYNRVMGGLKEVLQVLEAL